MYKPLLVAASTICAFAVSGCGDRTTATDAPVVADKKGEATKSVQPSSGQKQFLSVEPVAGSRNAGIVTLPGRIAFRPKGQSSVGVPVAGRVSALHVRTGEIVKAGAPVLTLESADASSVRANLDIAAARLAAAETSYRRNVEMVGKGVGLESERQEAELRLKEARTEHERARQTAGLIGRGSSGRVTVTAPTNGVVIAIRVAVGATVAPGGDALVELGDPAHLQVVAQVSESDLRRIAVGQTAEVDLPGLNIRVPANVETISPRVEAESRRLQIYLTLARRIEGLQAGMLAQIALQARDDAAISVPVSAVLIKDGKRRVVYVEKTDGRFEARDVETGANRDGRIIILKGLVAGENIVVRGALLLDAQAELLL